MQMFKTSVCLVLSSVYH